MELEQLRAFFGWCTVVNGIVLIVWFLFLVFLRDWIVQLHAKIFDLEIAEVRSVHYRVMAYLKLGIVLLNFTPYLALRIMA